MKDGFIKIACATPDLRPGDCEYNTGEIRAWIRHAQERGVKIVCFPELAVTGYTCGDLFLQTSLLEGAKESLWSIAEETREREIVALVGVPMAHKDHLYNCAAVLGGGKILGIVPKTHIPNYGEFYEARHFASGSGTGEMVNIKGEDIYFGTDQVFTCVNEPSLVFGVELCEDLWVGDTPSVKLARQGAVIIFNLSASDEIIGKADYRQMLVKAKSGSLFCAYAYADAGIGESTQDMVFAGAGLIAENGALLAQAKPFAGGLTVADVDIFRLRHERQRASTWQSAEEKGEKPYQRISFSLRLPDDMSDRYIPPHPFVPSEREQLAARCEEILSLQAAGLMTRLRHIGAKTAVVGLSGGLDSTLALIVMAHAFDWLGLDRKGIIAVTMPCFGTTDRTYRNACRLCEAYGASLREIRIEESVRQHFHDIGQDEAVHDVTYENSQARERTQVLMDIANQMGGIVVGTGDLSELALGWATYNGDHMSMYGVNASVPKTLVRYLVGYEAARAGEPLGGVLRDILDTPVSPELLPPEGDGTIAQRTEEVVGPYELHDFFLYYMARHGFPPGKIFRMAQKAFAGTYTAAEILKWETTFYRRFFSQQFKRSCLPDSPKVGSVTLSPRGDWRMPSDASARLWLRELEALREEEP